MQADTPRLHSPPPSAAAPRPKGILKNASTTSVPTTASVPPAGTDADAAGASNVAGSAARGAAGAEGAGASAAPSSEAMNVDSAGVVSPGGGRLQWDETNLTLHEIERENTAARMKIDEPKTPFVRGSSLGPDDFGEENFALDGSSSSSSYFPPGPSSSSASGGTGSASSSRRPSAAEQTKANTAANARIQHTPVQTTSSGLGIDVAASSSAGGQDAAMEGDDAVMSTDAPLSGGVEGKGRAGTNADRKPSSRSPSFTLPDGVVLAGGRRRSSAASSAAGTSRNGVRRERDAFAGANGGDAAMNDTFLSDDDEDEEEEEDVDVETQKKKQEFKAKRKGHYGNEAEALKAAKALADEEEDEDEEEGGGLPPPPVPPVPAQHR